MNNSVFRINLDIHRQTTQANLSVKKGDTARKIVAALSDGGRPYRIDEGCYAVFKAKKPDGNVLYNDCSIENNCIVYEFTEQTASSAGYMHCELQLYGPDGKIITSPKFAIIVSGLVYDDSEVESSDEFTALEKALTELAELKANGLKGDQGPQGEPGPMGPRGEPFRIYLFEVAAGVYEADKGYDAVKQNHEAGQQIICCLEQEQQWLELPMVKEGAGVFTFCTVVDGVEWRVEISNGVDGAAVVALEEYKFASKSDLRPPLYVNADDTTEQITAADMKAAHLAGRILLCKAENRVLTFDTYSTENPIVYFACVYKGKEYRVRFEDVNGVRVVTNETISLATKAELYLATNEIYFDITDDGVVSLKPAYRGACASAKADYQYGLSDNGVNVDGSRNAELPDEIVIPEIINGIAVKALAKAMFMGNRRIKRLVIPNWIKEIPNHFCYQATSLEAITGTENVTKMGKNAFYYTGIRKAYFPSLTEFVDGSHFMGCANLVVADLGKVFAQANAAVPRRCFSNCEKLEYIRNAEGITSIGEQGLYATYTLSNKDFLPNLKSIGNYGMLLSRADCDWDALSGYNGFGVLSTANHINKYDYSGCKFTPCNNPMRSTFSQHNPKWKDEYIVDYTDENGKRVYCQYEYGCAYVSCAMVYSALMGVDMESPEEFVEAVRKANPELLKVDIADGRIGTDNSQPDTEYIEMRQWLDAVGLKGTFYSSPSPENVQKVYEALANGALVIVRRLGDYTGGNHHTVIHGVNSKGELLAVDSSAANRAIGIYEAVTFAMPVQNMMRDYEGANITGNISLGYGEDWFMVVTKK